MSFVERTYRVSYAIHRVVLHRRVERQGYDFLRRALRDRTRPLALAGTRVRGLKVRWDRVVDQGLNPALRRELS